MFFCLEITSAGIASAVVYRKTSVGLVQLFPYKCNKCSSSFDLSKIKSQLHYVDVVDPVVALKSVAVWLRENPIGERGERGERGAQYF